MMTPEKLPTKKNLSALDEYINKVYILVLLLVPGACECAGLAYTFSKMMGWLPTVSWAALIIFDLTCLIYLAIAVFFIKTGIRDGYVMQDKLKAGKIFLVLVMLIQFNFIVYMTRWWRSLRLRSGHPLWSPGFSMDRYICRRRMNIFR